MGKIYVVGLGPGSYDYILPKAVDILEGCDLIIGFQRAIKSIKFIKSHKIIVNSLNEIKDIIKRNSDKNISIAASGDPCFYGITNYLKNNITSNLEIIPGISSFQYLMNKLSMSWHRAYLGSMHGREENFLNAVRNNEISIWLTDKENTPGKLSEILVKNKIAADIYVGENLSYDDEKITKGTVNEIMKMTFSHLCVMIIINNEVEN